MKTILSFIFVIATLCARADSGSNSGSCSGYTHMGFFFAYTYQFAVVMLGTVHSENHSFSFMGFLAGMEKAPVIGGNENHIIYRSGNIDLAVPYKTNANLLVRDNSSGHWAKLCSY